jgi:hypothetical protein
MSSRAQRRCRLRRRESRTPAGDHTHTAAPFIFEKANA